MIIIYDVTQFTPPFTHAYGRLRLVAVLQQYCTRCKCDLSVYKRNPYYNCHQMSSFTLKMHQTSMSAESLPQTPLRGLIALPQTT